MTGENLADRLTDTRHEISVVEIEEETANRLRERLDVAKVVIGDGTNRDVLKDAGIEEADTLVALAPEDETNLLVCRIAKELFSGRVIARVQNDEYSDLFKEMEVDVVVSATSSTVGLLEKAAVSAGLYGMVTMGGEEGDVVEIEVTEGSEAEGKAIEELGLPELCIVGLIRREGELVSPEGSTVFQEGDQVVLVGKSERIISSIELFNQD